MEMNTLKIGAVTSYGCLAAVGIAWVFWNTVHVPYARSGFGLILTISVILFLVCTGVGSVGAWLNHQWAFTLLRSVAWLQLSFIVLYGMIALFGFAFAGGKGGFAHLSRALVFDVIAIGLNGIQAIASLIIFRRV